MPSLGKAWLTARVKAIEDCAAGVIDAHCYRNGEVERLLARLA